MRIPFYFAVVMLPSVVLSSSMVSNETPSTRLTPENVSDFLNNCLEVSRGVCEISDASQRTRLYVGEHGLLARRGELIAELSKLGRSKAEVDRAKQIVSRLGAARPTNVLTLSKDSVSGPHCSGTNWVAGYVLDANVSLTNAGGESINYVNDFNGTGTPIVGYRIAGMETRVTDSAGTRYTSDFDYGFGSLPVMPDELFATTISTTCGTGCSDIFASSWSYSEVGSAPGCREFIEITRQGPI